MYLFLFRAPKHGSSYNYYRYKKSNTRGEFDLRALRKATKGTVKIWGYGTHPAHLLLQDHGMGHLLNGHLLEVDDPKAAVWIKLNYDLLGKNGVKYVGGIKDLDIEIMRNLSKLITRLDAERRDINQHTWTATNLVGALDRVLANVGADDSHRYVSKETAHTTKTLRALLKSDMHKRDVETSDLGSQLVQAKNDLEIYVKGCGMDPGSR